MKTPHWIKQLLEWLEHANTVAGFLGVLAAGIATIAGLPLLRYAQAPVPLYWLPVSWLTLGIIGHIIRKLRARKFVGSSVSSIEMKPSAPELPSEVKSVTKVISAPSNQPNYQEDHFKGLLWRWSWVSRYGTSKASSLRVFCPACDFEMTDNYSYEGPRYNRVLIFECSSPGCEKDYVMPGNYDSCPEFKKEVARLIERNQRNGWRGEVAPQLEK